MAGAGYAGMRSLREREMIARNTPQVPITYVLVPKPHQLASALLSEWLGVGKALASWWTVKR